MGGAIFTFLLLEARKTNNGVIRAQLNMLCFEAQTFAVEMR